MQKQVYTLVVDFSIQGDLAYLSHQETLKMFQRAMIRASVPLSFTMGFNPHPRLSIPFPRSVGTQSQGDRVCAVIEPPEVFSVEEITAQIQHQLPAGCTILDVKNNPGKSVFHPQKVCYIFHLKSSLNTQDKEHLNYCRKKINEKVSIEIQRYLAKKKSYKKFDVSSYLEALNFTDNKVEVDCAISPSGTVRIDELMQWLNIMPERIDEPVCRAKICWSQN